YGFYIGEGRVVYAADISPLRSNFSISRQFFDRWQYVCQFGVGLPALPALVQTYRAQHGKPPIVADWFMRPPKMVPDFGQPFISEDDSKNGVTHPHELAKWCFDLGDRFEIGTVFTVIAGLLNILAIYD